jgi:hypothetical protein
VFIEEERSCTRSWFNLTEAHPALLGSPSRDIHYLADDNDRFSKSPINLPLTSTDTKFEILHHVFDFDEIPSHMGGYS